MLQLWSSRRITHSVFVCETEEHAGKLELLACKYGVELIVRPPEMLHPLDDSGSIPVFWAFRKAIAERYYTLVTMPFVVAPCRPPGFFDDMVTFYCKTFGNPDFIHDSPQIMGGFRSDLTPYDVSGGRGKQIWTPYLNLNPDLRMSCTNHVLMASWYYEAQTTLQNSRHDVTITPVIWDIEPWADIHIDTEDHWKEAEFWFREKILSKGEDCYEKYRKSWHTE